MKKRIGIDIDSLEHTKIKSQASLLSMSIGKYLIYCHQTVGKLTHLARNAGNEYQEIPEAIDELFECQATEDAIVEKLSQFAEQTQEEAEKMITINY